MGPDPSFSVDVSSVHEPKETLVIGLSNVGMAALTAADYLIRQLDTEEIGHIAPAEFPAIAPFELGEPRHHTRLYNVRDSPVSVLVGELFIPVWAAQSFADAVFDWVDTGGVAEIAVLHGVPYPHGPDEHAVFHVATPEYRDARITDTEIAPLGGGFFDGVVGEIVTRSLDGQSPPVGVYVTPTHPPGPDIDAALLLLDAVETVYGIRVDEEELRGLSEDLNRYYAELTDRMASLSEADQSLTSRDYPEDRMYM